MYIYTAVAAGRQGSLLACSDNHFFLRRSSGTLPAVDLNFLSICSFFSLLDEVAAGVPEAGIATYCDFGVVYLAVIGTWMECCFKRMLLEGDV